MATVLDDINKKLNAEEEQDLMHQQRRPAASMPSEGSVKAPVAKPSTTLEDIDFRNTYPRKQARPTASMPSEMPQANAQVAKPSTTLEDIDFRSTYPRKQARPTASMPSEMPQANAQVAKPSTTLEDIDFRSTYPRKQSRPEANMPSEMPTAKAQVAKPSTTLEDIDFRNPYSHKQSRPTASMPSEMPQANAQVAKPSTPTTEMAFRNTNNTSPMSSTKNGNIDDINRKLNAEEQQDLMHKKMKEVLETPTPKPKKDDDKPVTTYSEMYAKLNPRPSDEEQAAERKRQRRNALIAAIGDGISAIANMYYAGKGAPSSYDPKQGMSAKLQERYDKLNAERRAHDKEWRAGYARAQALDQQALAAKERNERMLEKLRQQQEQWQQAQKLKERTQSHREDNDRIRHQERERELAIKDKLAGKKGSSGGSRKPQYDKEVVQSVSVDANGNPVKKTETKFTPSGSSRSGSSSSNNTPPGRRNRNTSNNTPPSRRQNR